MLDKSFLEETLTAWGHIRQGTIAEVENIPADKFDFSPTPEMRSLHDLVVHILEVSYFAMNELPRPDTDVKRAPMKELFQKYAKDAYEAKSKDDLVNLLKRQHEQGVDRYREFGDLGMWQSMKQFDGSEATKFQWWHHMLAEEMYHRGQIALYARTMGIEPALTKMIRGAG